MAGHLKFFRWIPCCGQDGDEFDESAPRVRNQQTLNRWRSLNSEEEGRSQPYRRWFSFWRRSREPCNSHPSRVNAKPTDKQGGIRPLSLGLGPWSPIQIPYGYGGDRRTVTIDSSNNDDEKLPGLAASRPARATRIYSQVSAGDTLTTIGFPFNLGYRPPETGFDGNYSPQRLSAVNDKMKRNSNSATSRRSTYSAYWDSFVNSFAHV